MSPDDEQRVRSNALAELIYDAVFVTRRICTETETRPSARELVDLRLLLLRLEQLLAESDGSPIVNGRQGVTHFQQDDRVVQLSELSQTVLKLRVALETVTITPAVRTAARQFFDLFRAQA